MNEFDKHIKDKISGHESPTSPDLWSKMEAKRAVNDLEKGIKKGSSKLWSFLFIALLLSSGVVYSYYISLDSKKSSESVETKIVTPQTDLEIAKIDSSLKVDSQKSNLSSNDNSLELKDIDENSNLSNNKNNLKNNYTNPNYNNKKSKILIPDFSGKQASIQERLSDQKERNKFVSKTFADNKVNLESYSSILPSWPLFNKNSKISYASSRDDITCGDYPRNYPFTYYLDFGFAPQRTVKYFSVKDEKYKSYAQQREYTEGFHFGYSLSARLSVVHFSGITLKTGLQYHQTNDFFEYKDDNYTEVVDTGVVTGLLDIAQYNRYKSFDVPIMVGYELDVNSFTFALNTGIHANVGFTKNGYILSHDETVSQLQNDNTIYKNWVGLSWAANVGAYFHLNNRMQLMMEPHFRYSLMSLTTKNYPLEQRNFSTGMRLGLRVRM